MISIVLGLPCIIVLNFENDSQKSTHHVTYDIYQRIFFFDHHRYHNHFVLRVNWIYHFSRLKKKTKTEFLANIFY